MRMLRTRTLIATAAVAAATATAGFMIASTAGASTTTAADTLTAATGKTGAALSIAASESTIAIGQQDTISGVADMVKDYQAQKKPLDDLVAQEQAADADLAFGQQQVVRIECEHLG